MLINELFHLNFLMIGYQFKSNYDCGDYFNMLAYHATLMEAIAYCNGHGNCNCIHLDKEPGYPNLKNYMTYTFRHTPDYPTLPGPNKIFDSWVI